MSNDILALWDAHRAASNGSTVETVGDPTGDASNELAGIIRKLESATEGERNDRLNWAAFAVGGYIAGGHTDELEMEPRLEAAATFIGLEPGEIKRTIRSGINDGKLHPRHPRQKGTVNVKTGEFTPWAASSAGSGSTNGEQHTTSTTGAADDVTAAQSASTTETPTGYRDLDEPDEIDYRARHLAAEVEQQRLRRDARRQLEAEELEASFRIPPYFPTLTRELLEPEEPITYTFDRMLPCGGNVLLTAQFKTGKTTLVNQAAKAFADQTPFLGRFDTNAIDGNVALFNYEVDARQYRRWMRDAGIANTDRVVLLNLRGFRMPVTAPHVEDWVVSWLAEHNIALWIVDPFARAFTGGVSENDNAEVGRFLDTLDVIKERAGVADLILPTHTGRAVLEQGDERARGATRLDDWADVRWILTKDDQGARYLSATGRDVDVDEEELVYHEATRSMTFGGHDRNGVRKRRLEDWAVQAVNANPGIGVVDLRVAIRALGGKGANEVIDKGAKDAAAVHRIRRVEHEGTTKISHFPAGS